MLSHKIKLPCELAASLLGTYSKDSRPTYSRDNCTSVFAVALFTIAELWNQPRCPTTGEWVKKTQVFSHKEGSSVAGRKIGATEDNHIKRLNPASKGQMPCFLLLWLLDSIEIHKTVGV